MICWQETPIHSVAAEVGPIGGVVTEIIITFGLVYTVYATAADPKKGSIGTIAPIAIGFIVGANILAAGPFSGGSMNPARSFGPAVVSGNFHDNWIYWAGPLIGGGLAGLIYGNVFMHTEHAPLSSDFWFYWIINLLLLAMLCMWFLFWDNEKEEKQLLFFSSLFLVWL